MIECRFTKEELQYMYNELHLWAKTEEQWKTVEKIKNLIQIIELNEEVKRLEKMND